MLDEKRNAISGASVELASLADSNLKRSLFTDKSGEFSFNSISFGWFKLKITSIGYSPLVIDSIHVRAERFDFSLNDLVLKQAASQMAEVVVYAEKPLIQSKDGNITFNAAESPLSAGSNASELLKNVPLITQKEPHHTEQRQIRRPQQNEGGNGRNSPNQKCRQDNARPTEALKKAIAALDPEQRR